MTPSVSSDGDVAPGSSADGARLPSKLAPAAVLRERIVLVARALLVAAAFTPFVPAATSDTALAPLGAALDAWFGFHCHRDTARTLAASAVCARCLGIYAGLAAGALAARPRLAPARHLAWVALGAGLLVLDVLSEAAGLRPPSSALRFVTGAFFAYPAAVSIVTALSAPRASERATGLLR